MRRSPSNICPVCDAGDPTSVITSCNCEEPRTPLPAPFPVGATVRYIGTSRVFADAAGKQPLLYPGMQFTVVAIREGRQGTGRILAVDEETGDPYYDETSDAASIYQEPHRGGRRSIRADNANEWEVI